MAPLPTDDALPSPAAQQVVPPGTNGAVSLRGLLASAAGGLFIGVVFWASGIVSLADQVEPDDDDDDDDDSATS